MFSFCLQGQADGAFAIDKHGDFGGNKLWGAHIHFYLGNLPAAENRSAPLPAAWGRCAALASFLCGIAHKGRLIRAYGQIQALNARQRLYRNLCLIGKGMVIYVFCHAADAIAAHLSP